MARLKRRKNEGNGQEKPDDKGKLTVFEFTKAKGSKQILQLKRSIEEVVSDYTVVYQGKVKTILAFEDVARAIVKCDGYIGRTAIVLGVNVKTLRKFIQKNQKLQDLIEDVTEATLDLAESRLRDKIILGDTTAILFHLKCKGRQRGWTEDQSPTADQKPVTFKYETVLPEGMVLVPLDKVKQDESAAESQAESN